MGDDKRKTIFLIEEDDETRPLLKENLQRDGYKVMLALDEEDALQRATDGAALADLILINLVGQPPLETLAAGRRIREHGKYDGITPLVVIADDYGDELEGRNVNVSANEWITYLGDPEQLGKLLARLLDNPQG
jgi:CheY-like chemotaxis protein